MAYSSGGLIQATDFNTRATSVNNLWGVGSGNSGYGQSGTALNTNISGTVAATDWATMIARMSTMQQHQANNTTGIPSQPSSGGIITYLSSLDTAVTSLQNNRLTSYALSSATGAVTTNNSSTWNTSKTLTWTFTFASGDAARYFFNTGGYLQLVSTGNTLNESQWNSFINTGFSSLNIYANSIQHNGTVGTLTRNTYLNTQGYYNLTTTPTEYLRLTDTGTGNSAYNSNYLRVSLSSNGTQGSNGDAGSVITVTFYLYNADTNTFQLPLSGTSTGTVQYFQSETTYLSSSWGTPTWANTVNSVV